MRVLITGATGFIGRALVLRLRRAGHQPVAWVRSRARGLGLLGQEAELVATEEGDANLIAALGTCEGVINLAGESVVGGRWSAARKRALTDSRVATTTRLVQAMAAASPRPKVLVSASAVGWYGDCGSQAVDEHASAGGDFLATLCVQWEAAARQAEALGVRVALARLGVVLGHEGGMLGATLPLFELGLGGVLGSGEQYVPWVHLHDVVEALTIALTDPRYQGPYNVVAPAAVDNRTYTHALAAAVHQTAPMRMPAAVMRALLGEACAAALASQRVVPRRLREWDFPFQYEQLVPALGSLLDFSLVDIGPLRDDSPKPLQQSDYLARRRPLYLLQAGTRLPKAQAEVFEFFCRAENLGLMTPAPMALAIAGTPPAAMHVGLEINYTLRVGPVPARWRTRICHWDAPNAFVDAQLKGPYHCWWHEHHFTAEGDTTLMQDRVFYAPPFGPLGQIAQHAGVAAQLRRIFWYRASAIQLRFGTASV